MSLYQAGCSLVTSPRVAGRTSPLPFPPAPQRAGGLRPDPESGGGSTSEAQTTWAATPRGGDSSGHPRPGGSAGSALLRPHPPEGTDASWQECPPSGRAFSRARGPSVRWAPRPQRAPWRSVSGYPGLSELGTCVQGWLGLRAGVAWPERRAGAGRVVLAWAPHHREVAERKGGRQWSPCGRVCT